MNGISGQAGSGGRKQRKKMELKFEKENVGGQKNLKLLCPKCGFDYCKVGHHYHVEGQDSYEAPWWGRGDLDVIEMESECGCHWEFCLGFHKGQTFMFAKIIDPCSTEKDKYRF